MTYGLNETAARTYLTLLGHPTLNVGTLAKITQAPRSHLYSVLQDLQARGLVDVTIEGNTRTYRANPFSEYLKRWMEDYRGRIEEVELLLPEIEAVYRPPPLEDANELETGTLRLVMGRRAVARQIDTMLERAEDTVIVSSTARGFERVLRHVRPYERVWATEEGVLTRNVKILVPTALQQTGGVERLGEVLTPCVQWMPIPRETLVVAVDDAEMLIVHPIPDNDAFAAGRDYALHTTNKAFVRSHVDLLLAVVAPRAADAARAVSPRSAAESS